MGFLLLHQNSIFLWVQYHWRCSSDWLSLQVWNPPKEQTANEVLFCISNKCKEPRFRGERQQVDLPEALWGHSCRTTSVTGWIGNSKRQWGRKPRTLGSRSSGTGNSSEPRLADTSSRGSSIFPLHIFQRMKWAFNIGVLRGKRTQAAGKVCHSSSNTANHQGGTQHIQSSSLQIHCKMYLTVWTCPVQSLTRPVSVSESYIPMSSCGE